MECRPGTRPAGAFALGLLIVAILPTDPARASWSRAAPGSWVVVESRDHGLAERPPERVTTTLVRRQGDLAWFDHRGASGEHWQDTDGRDEADPQLPARARVEQRTLGTATLRLDGRVIRCRLLELEATTSPFQANHPVREWVVRQKRWVATDSALAGRVLRWVDLGTETRFRDGRRQRTPGLWTETVKTFHEPVRVGGRSYDCWVVTRKESTESGDFARRTVVWRYEGTPAGWVKRFTEARDPRTGAMSRSEQRLVDFRYR
jgi:hypothetical protein